MQRMRSISIVNKVMQDYQMEHHQNFWRPVSIAFGWECLQLQDAQAPELAPHGILKVRFILPAQSWNPAPPTTAADQRQY